MGAFTSDLLKQHAPACWFPLNHAEAMRHHPRLHLRALCDRDAQALARAAAAHEVGITYTEPRQLLDEVRPVLLGIATRTLGRAALIQEALERGVRALHVEKPLCNGVRELQGLAAAVARPGVFVTYGAIRRFFPAYRLARELADSGRYGALREIRVQLGSGTLFWTHPHAVDLILFGAGEREIAGVQARLARVESGSSSVDVESDPLVVSATIHFHDGVTGHITQALGADVVLSCADAEIAVRADGGTLEVYAARNGALYPTAAPHEHAPSAHGPCGTLAPVSQLVACLDGDAAAIAGNAVVKRDLLAGQRILFAMLQSHLEASRIVAPAAIDDAMFIHARTNGRHA
jgi:scyllo-inositol 2-dehydrogenase (NAD+)